MRIALAVFVLAAIFVALALPFLGDPIDSWEWLVPCIGERIARAGVPSLDCFGVAAPAQADTLLLIHPPTAPYLSALALRWLGPGLEQTRLPGLVVTIAVAALLAALAYRREPMAERAQAVALLATALYLINPATIQGALYLGFSEGTLLPLTWLAFVAIWLETSARPLWIRIAALGPCLAVALWAKITTSLALPVAAAVIALFLQGPVTALAVLVGVSALGLALFLGTWWLYAVHLSTLTGIAAVTLWQKPFGHLAGEAPLLAPAEAPLITLRVLGYLGPLLLAAGAIAIVRRLQTLTRERRVVAEDLVPLLVAVVIGVHLVLPGGGATFPKYQLVVLPLLAWLAARELVIPERLSVSLGIAFLAAVGWAWFLVGDPLKVLNHDLRRAHLAGDVTEAALRLGGAALFLGLLPLALAAVLRRWRPALAVAALASQLALVATQARGDYFLRHQYGTPHGDFTRAVELLRASTPAGAMILALPEFGYAARRPVLGGLGHGLWIDGKRLEATVRLERPAAVVYGLPTHTVAQVRGYASAGPLRATLERGYRRVDVGDFTVWLRNP